MRCFLAVELSREAREELKKIQEKLKPYLLGNFVDEKNMHLTLKFFGELDEKDIKDIKKALKELKFEKFTASLGKIGFFPSEDKVNIVWIALEPENRLSELNFHINSCLKGLGLRKDEFNFQSHITLARVKSIKNKQDFLIEARKLEIKPIKFEVKEFILKKSVLMEYGPVYSDIEKFELG